MKIEFYASFHPPDDPLIIPKKKKKKVSSQPLRLAKAYTDERITLEQALRRVL